MTKEEYLHSVEKMLCSMVDYAAADSETEKQSAIHDVACWLLDLRKNLQKDLSATEAGKDGGTSKKLSEEEILAFDGPVFPWAA